MIGVLLNRPWLLALVFASTATVGGGNRVRSESFYIYFIDGGEWMKRMTRGGMMRVYTTIEDITNLYVRCSLVTKGPRHNGVDNY